MDGTAAELVFEDQGAHTSNRKSARSSRVEVLVRADRRRSWLPEQKFQIVSESLEHGVMATDVARRHGIGTGLLQRSVSTQPEDPDGTAPVSRANQAAARERISRSTRSCLFSRRSRLSSSRLSAVIAGTTAAGFAAARPSCRLA